MDSWEEGFDVWTPPAAQAAGEATDTGTDLNRDELLRLARELAGRRLAAQAAELETRGAVLEAEAARIAAQERELETELAAAQVRLSEAIAEQELTAAERERLEERDRAVHEQEKALAAVRIELEQERRRLGSRTHEPHARAAALDAGAEAEQKAS